MMVMHQAPTQLNPCLIAFLALTLIFPTNQSSVDKLPNIIILLADNLGYNDISIFGAPTAITPNIDSLAHRGLKLNNWNSAEALCSASRSTLLTGKHAVRTGVYPRVFKPDAVYGLPTNHTILSEYLKESGYATSIIGKWHLGHREEYIPTNRGFDEWFGIPYHMSGGSIDGHVCGEDINGTMWLPLFGNETIIEQPVDLTTLGPRYAENARTFIRNNVEADHPFFLYLAFSHVHQLCAPDVRGCQWASRDFSDKSPIASFVNAVEEMDWIVGQVLEELKIGGIEEDTLVIFTSDNGPWIAEQGCSGSKGPFEGRWLQDNVDQSCTACYSRYIPAPLPSQPRRCIYPGTNHETEGIHCGEDTGLGGLWEANIRMPALARWIGVIPEGVETMEMVSTLDIVPTILGLLERKTPDDLDGENVMDVLLGKANKSNNGEERMLFFWRDGFQTGPLPSPYGRFDLAAVKYGRIKAWFWTKSAHYNPDVEVFHDPPLLFDVLKDPAEAFPLDPNLYQEVIGKIMIAANEHKASIKKWEPLALETNAQYLPCVNADTHCRTTVKHGDTSDTTSTVTEE